MTKNIRIISLLLSVILCSNISAQEYPIEKWVPIKKDANIRIYMDVYGLENVKGDDIYIWTREYYEPPIIIETINGKIYSAKINYLINKELKKYSIMEIIYYDEENNVLQDFNYERNSEIEEYQYNYPIMLDSDIDLIFEECLKYIWQK